MAEAAAMPHVLLFPFPSQGHVHPMLKLAELISNAGIHVTFLNTENIHGCLLHYSAAFRRLLERPMFRFRTIPDGLPEDDPRPFLQFLYLEESLRTRSRGSYRELLAKPADVDGLPKVSCVVTDRTLRLAFEVADQMDIPVVIFHTSSACSIWAYHSIPALIAARELPLSEEANIDELMQGVEGMGSFLRRRDLPGLMRNAKSASNHSLRFLTAVCNNLPRARALILNTVEHLDSSNLSYIRSICHVTYNIGPLQLLHKNLKGPTGHIGRNVQSSSDVSQWKEDKACMTWLDHQPNKSVVYVSFGTITVISQETILEFWHGLVSSGHQPNPLPLSLSLSLSLSHM